MAISTLSRQLAAHLQKDNAAVLTARQALLEAFSAFVADHAASKRKGKGVLDVSGLKKNILPEVSGQLLHALKLADKGVKGPNAPSKLIETFIEDAFLKTIQNESIGIDRLGVNFKDDSIEVFGRAIGDTQDYDTEVPAQLNDETLLKTLYMLGAARQFNKTDLSWGISRIQDKYTAEFCTTYKFHATFPMNDLIEQVLGEAEVTKLAHQALA